jgi:cell division protein FtsW
MVNETNRSSQSLKDRRLKVLRRTGLADKQKSRLTLDKPPAAFFWIQIIVFVLALLGLVMVLSSSSVTNLHSGSSAWSMFSKQLAWVVVGVIAGLMAYRQPYSVWKNDKLLFAVTSVIVGANVLVLLKGQLINGAKAWLDIGPFRFQPSEFMKIALILFCANFLSSRHRAVAVRNVVLYPLIFSVFVTAGLCALQKDFGSAIIFAGIVLAMMFMSAMPIAQIIATFIGMSMGGILVLKFARRASDRLLAFMDLEATKADSGYQVYQALLSIANGGWAGTGIGSGTSKWGYVPLAYSDFIFAVVAEELGIFGTVLVIGGFMLLVFFGIQVALSASDMHGAFIAGGISAWFGIQAIVNIGGVVGMMPMTGLTLPFLSYGGSSMIASMIAIGLLLNVARYAKKQ